MKKRRVTWRSLKDSNLHVSEDSRVQVCRFHPLAQSCMKPGISRPGAGTRRYFTE